MNYIVMDLEWTQKDQSKDNRNPSDLLFEIIEIGAVKLNSNLKTVGTFSKLIKPVLSGGISYITREITSLNKMDFKKADGFEKVFKEFIKWCGEDYVFCTWGPIDVTELQKNMKYYGFPLLPFPVIYYDIQKIYSIEYDDGKSRRALETAVDELGLKKYAKFHRALDDARYTSDILIKLGKEAIEKHNSIDTYQIPVNKKEEIYVDYPDYSKYISRGYENKSDMMQDKTVTATICPVCKKKLKKKIRWFASNTKSYISLAICPEHGYIKSKIRLKKSAEGLVFASRTTKLADAKMVLAVYERRDEVKKKKKKETAGE